MIDMEKNKNSEILDRHCVDSKNNWGDFIDFDASDEELEKFYAHVEICSYHQGLIEKADASLSAILQGIQMAFDDGNEGGENVADACSVKMLFDTACIHHKEILNGLSDSDENHGHLGHFNPEHLANAVLIIGSGRTAQYIMQSMAAYRIECDFSKGMTESRATLLYFGLSSAAEDNGVNIVSQHIVDIEQSQFRASFEIVANDEQLERISSNFESHIGVTSLHVTDTPLTVFKCGDLIGRYPGVGARSRRARTGRLHVGPSPSEKSCQTGDGDVWSEILMDDKKNP